MILDLGCIQLYLVDQLGVIASQVLNLFNDRLEVRGRVMKNVLGGILVNSHSSGC
ncbi:hypothetical protein D3C80_1857250 [compost metagenome]